MAFGDWLDSVGTKYNLPEIGLSELFSGGRTENTGRVDYSPIAGLATGVVAPGQAIGGALAYHRATSGGDKEDVKGTVDKTPAGVDGGSPPPSTVANQSGGGDTYGGGSGGGATYDPMYDTYLGRVDDVLARALGAYNTQKGNVNQQYNTRRNELNSQENQRRGVMQDNRLSNQQALMGNRNAIRDRASQGLRGLLSVLGQQGAGGSSAAEFVAPGAVADVSTAQRAGANENYRRNEQSIDTSWNSFLNQLKNERNKLSDWRDNSLNQLKSDYNRLTDNVGDIRSDLSARRGSAAQLGSNLLGIRQSIPNVIDRVSSYKGNTPVYDAPDLSSYNVATTPGAQLGGGEQSTEFLSNTPFLELIRRRDERNRGY